MPVVQSVSRARAIIGGRYRLTDLLRVETASLGEKALAEDVLAMLTQEPVFIDYAFYQQIEGRVEAVRQPDAERGQIKVGVSGGRIRLEGRVASLSHWRIAEVLSGWTEGCERVDNRLEVVPPEHDRDEEITDVVRMVLAKDPLVRDVQIRVPTRDGVVELDGMAASGEERRLVVLDVWAVPGLRDILDHIQTPQRVSER